VVMELLAGPSLDGLLATRGPLPVEVALGYAEQAAAGLAAAHAAGWCTAISSRPTWCWTATAR
jgi:serine/threonine protein kinase